VPLRLSWFAAKNRFFFFMRICHTNHEQNNVARALSPENWSGKRVLADQHPRRPDTKPSESITDSRKFVDALEPYDEEFSFCEQWGEKLLTSSRPVSPIGWPKLPTLSQSLTQFSNTSFPIPHYYSSQTILSCSEPFCRWYDPIYRLVK